ncbi:MAG: 1-acyl-sn-glycerol-3-phosphate acyltransferase [Planctomycetota bacterium]
MNAVPRDGQWATEAQVVEQHLGRSDLVAEVCLLPGAGADPFLDCRAVVVPAAETLQAQAVFLAHERLRELLAVASISAPRPLRVQDVLVVRQPLPRRGEALDRPRVAELVERHARARAALLGGEVSAETSPLRERLRDALGVEGPWAPGARLGPELGIDSLKLIQLRALLAEEFGVEVPHREVWELLTLGDLEARVAGAAPSGVPGDYGWARLLRQRVDEVPLGQRFNLARRGVHWWAAQLGMYAFTAAAKLGFRAELLHRERLPRRGPYLLCPTHQSMIDSPLLYALFPYAVVHRFMILAYGPYFRGPLAAMIRMGRVILTGEANTVADSLKLAFQGLERGYVVCMFPEGNCSYTGGIMPPRPGVGILSCEAQVPIVPVLFQGSHRLLSPLSPGVRLTPIRAIVGDPIQPPAPRRFARVDYEAVAQDWLRAVQALAADNPWPHA